VGHTVRRCPQPEEPAGNEYGSGDYAAGDDYGQGNTQQEESTWTDTNEITDQFAELKTVDAQENSGW